MSDEGIHLAKQLSESTFAGTSQLQVNAILALPDKNNLFYRISLSGATETSKM